MFHKFFQEILRCVRVYVNIFPHVCVVDLNEIYFLLYHCYLTVDKLTHLRIFEFKRFKRKTLQTFSYFSNDKIDSLYFKQSSKFRMRTEK